MEELGDERVEGSITLQAHVTKSEMGQGWGAGSMLGQRWMKDRMGVGRIGMGKRWQAGKFFMRSQKLQVK